MGLDLDFAPMGLGWAQTELGLWLGWAWIYSLGWGGPDGPGLTKPRSGREIHIHFNIRLTPE